MVHVRAASYTTQFASCRRRPDGGDHLPDLRWRRTTSATALQERAASPDGPWVLIATAILGWAHHRAQAHARHPATGAGSTDGLLPHLSCMTTESTLRARGTARPYRLRDGLKRDAGHLQPGTRGGCEADRLASAILSAAQQIGDSFGVALMTSYATQHAQDYGPTMPRRSGGSHGGDDARLWPCRSRPLASRSSRPSRPSSSTARRSRAYSGGFSMMA